LFVSCVTIEPSALTLGVSTRAYGTRGGSRVHALKAERWMKARHVPATLKHDPKFILTTGWKMLGHAFRGSSIRSALGLESDRKVFERYREIRRAEREYV
jgi:hypothetical protein